MIDEANIRSIVKRALSHSAGRILMAQALTPIIQRRVEEWRTTNRKPGALSQDETSKMQGCVMPEAFVFAADIPLKVAFFGEATAVRDFLHAAEECLKTSEDELQRTTRGMVPLPLIVESVDDSAAETIGFHLKQQYAKVI